MKIFFHCDGSFFNFLRLIKAKTLSIFLRGKGNTRQERRNANATNATLEERKATTTKRHFNKT